MTSDASIPVWHPSGTQSPPPCSACLWSSFFHQRWSASVDCCVSRRNSPRLCSVVVIPELNPAYECWSSLGLERNLAFNVARGPLSGTWYPWPAPLRRAHSMPPLYMHYPMQALVSANASLHHLVALPASVSGLAQPKAPEWSTAGNLPRRHLGLKRRRGVQGIGLCAPLQRGHCNVA